MVSGTRPHLAQASRWGRLLGGHRAWGLLLLTLATGLPACDSEDGHKRNQAVGGAQNGDGGLDVDSGSGGTAGAGGAGGAAGAAGAGAAGAGAAGGSGGVAGGGGVAPTPGQSGSALVPGGNLMKSPRFKLVGTTGAVGNGVQTSSRFRVHAGLVGATQ